MEGIVLGGGGAGLVLYNTDVLVNSVLVDTFPYVMGCMLIHPGCVHTHTLYMVFLL